MNSVYISDVSYAVINVKVKKIIDLMECFIADELVYEVDKARFFFKQTPDLYNLYILWRSINIVISDCNIKKNISNNRNIRLEVDKECKLLVSNIQMSANHILKIYENSALLTIFELYEIVKH